MPNILLTLDELIELKTTPRDQRLQWVEARKFKAYGSLSDLRTFSRKFFFKKKYLSYSDVVENPDQHPTFRIISNPEFDQVTLSPISKTSVKIYIGQLEGQGFIRNREASEMYPNYKNILIYQNDKLDILIGKSRSSESTVINILDKEIPRPSDLRKLILFRPPSVDNRIKYALHNAIIKRIQDDTAKTGGELNGGKNWLEYAVTNDNDKEQVEAWENYNHYRNKFLNIFPEKETTPEYLWLLARIYFFSEVNNGEIVIEKAYENLVMTFLALSRKEEDRLRFFEE